MGNVAVAAVTTSLVMLASVPSMVVVAAQRQATVEGIVENGTVSQAVPSELPLVGLNISGDGEVLERVATMAQKGRFRLAFQQFFENSLLVVSAEYAGVTYRAEPTPAPAPSEHTHEATLAIYEPTDDVSVIKIRADTLTVVKGEGSFLEVFQLMRLENISDRTLVGREGAGGHETLLMPLPQGAREVLPGDGIASEVRPSTQGFATADPVLPGILNLNYLYKVEVPRSGWTLSKEVIYPTDRFDLLLSDDLELASGPLSLEEEVTLEGRRYRRYRTDAIGAGGTLVAAIAFADSGSSGLAIGALVLVTMLILVILGLVARRSRRRAAPGSAQRASQREELVEAIARLDESFEAGELDEGTYRRSRRQMKRRLEELTGDLVRR